MSQIAVSSSPPAESTASGGSRPAPAESPLWDRAVRRWNAFWFRPAEVDRLAAIRILAGLLGTHNFGIWLWASSEFFGADAWYGAAAARRLTSAVGAWSPLWNLPLPAVRAVLTAGLVASIALAAGIGARASAAAVWLIGLSVAHRAAPALFGFDQIWMMLLLYLSFAPSDATWSLAAFLRHGHWRAARRSVSANVALRLIQIHLCVVYLFAGLSKLRGDAWWNGTAFWGAIANAEYQTVDLTWLADWPVVVNLCTHGIVAFELAYCVLVWRPGWRSVLLAAALALHLGIGLCLGMMTFGLAMIAANLAFVPFERLSPSPLANNTAP